MIKNKAVSIVEKIIFIAKSIRWCPVRNTKQGQAEIKWTISSQQIFNCKYKMMRVLKFIGSPDGQVVAAEINAAIASKYWFFSEESE